LGKLCLNVDSPFPLRHSSVVRPFSILLTKPFCGSRPGSTWARTPTLQVNYPRSPVTKPSSKNIFHTPAPDTYFLPPVIRIPSPRDRLLRTIPHRCYIQARGFPSPSSVFSHLPDTTHTDRRSSCGSLPLTSSRLKQSIAIFDSHDVSSWPLQRRETADPLLSSFRSHLFSDSPSDEPFFCFLERCFEEDACSSPGDVPSLSRHFF